MNKTVKITQTAAEIKLVVTETPEPIVKTIKLRTFENQFPKVVGDGPPTKLKIYKSPFEIGVWGLPQWEDRPIIVKTFNSLKGAHTYFVNVCMNKGKEFYPVYQYI